MPQLNKIGDFLQSKDFLIEKISDRWYRLTPIDNYSNGAFTMTGSDVTKSVDVPFTFGLQRIHVYHHTSSIGTDSTDELQVHLQRPTKTITRMPFFRDRFWTVTDIVDPNPTFDFSKHSGGDGFVYEKGQLDIILNSTSTDLVQVIIYIKELK